LTELRSRIGDLVSALSPNALAILQSLMHDMLRSSCQHAFAGTSFGRADVLICSDAIEARQIAVQLALRKRYPLLVSDGLKAVTRPPVIYGDQNMLEDLHECAWSAMLTADSFCPVPRIKRDMFVIAVSKKLFFFFLTHSMFGAFYLADTLSCPIVLSSMTLQLPTAHYRLS
jgi:hypothetical protein